MHLFIFQDDSSCRIANVLLMSPTASIYQSCLLFISKWQDPWHSPEHLGRETSCYNRCQVKGSKVYTFTLKGNQDLGSGCRDKIPLLCEFFPPSKEFRERKFIFFMEKIIFYMNYENSVLYGGLHTSLHFSLHMRSTADKQSVAWRNWCQGVADQLGWLCKIHKDNLIFITQRSVFLEVFFCCCCFLLIFQLD